MKRITCSETAKIIRKVLKESFPKTKFSVKSSFSKIDISYTNGPSEKQVQDVVSVFEWSYFDSTQDYKGTNYAKLNGEDVIFGADFVFVDRKYTRDFLYSVVLKISDVYQLPNKITIEVSDYDKSAWVSKVEENAESIERGFSAYDIKGIIHTKMREKSEVETQQSETLKCVYGAGDDGYGYGCVGRLVA